MYSVYVFSQEEADRMVEQGLTIHRVFNDINGRKIWVCVAKDIPFAKEDMPQGVVVKHGLYMNF